MSEEQEVNDVIQDLARKIANVEVANSALTAVNQRLEREIAELTPYEE